MNVTFHVFASLATAAALSPNDLDNRWKSWRLIVGFVIGIILHGLFDYLPHSYPLRSSVDVVLAILLLSVALFFATNTLRLLILFCFAGSIFPDVIDLGPAITNKHFGIAVPQLPFKIFPWHWKEYSGSVYDNTKAFESAMLHVAVLGVGTAVLLFRRDIFKNLIQRSGF